MISVVLRFATQNYYNNLGYTSFSDKKCEFSAFCGKSNMSKNNPSTK